MGPYIVFYNEVRRHLALGKDAPLGRAVQRTGVIVAIPISSGLHQHYVRNRGVKSPKSHLERGCDTVVRS
jgi:hypothetical protein